jgi:hypothetical protein
MMNRALWLLIGLQTWGWLRFLGRSLRTVKGALLALVGLVVFVTWLAPVVLAPRTAAAANPDTIRRWGPVGLLVYCLLNVLVSSGERAVYFAPAEVNFLFAGPFGRRQLLAYKIIFSFLVGVPTTLFLTLVFQIHAAWFVAAYVGLLLAFLFMQLFALSVNLLATAIGARFYTRARRVVLAVLIVGGVAVLFQLGGSPADWNLQVFLERAEQTTAWKIVSRPLSWFIEAFLAERLWPDLVQYAALGLGVNALMVLLVFALDTNYLEAAAASSARLYALRERVRRGETVGMGASGGKPRLRLPSLPWLGGVGPIFWRQLTTALRGLGRLALRLGVIGLVLIGPAIAGVQDSSDREVLVGTTGSMVLFMTVFLTALVPFDFRGDVDRLDVLKALPIGTWSLTVGQLLTPVVVLTLVQWTVLAVAGRLLGSLGPLLLAFAVFAPPFNFLLFGLENLLFLLFPSRLLVTTPGDFQAMGRNVLFILGKMLGLTIVGLLAFLLGGLTYLLVRQAQEAGQLAIALPALDLVCGLVVAWLVLAACAVALVPLVAWAFTKFDVARDTPP